MTAFRLALCQLRVGTRKRDNLANARRLVLDAAREHGAQVVALPVCFTCWHYIEKIFIFFLFPMDLIFVKC